jgi:hypothetical protein
MGKEGQLRSDWNNRLRQLELFTNRDTICKKFVWEGTINFVDWNI